MSKDHPCGCGEHSGTPMPLASRLGSSPRMRGALKATHDTVAQTRIIPADAGSTPGCWTYVRVDLGSSPRMRGALKRLLARLCSKGIIPADAGSTCFLIYLLYVTQDHPRGCGEHLTVLSRTRTLRGSSPRMRGARLPQPWDLQPTGIIPADAGSTSRAFSVVLAAGDHPRGCGEHMV